MFTPELLQRLADATAEVDRTGTWPSTQLNWLAEADELGWLIPHEYGGSALSDGQVLKNYRELSENCLATAFILTQRNGACQRIAGSANKDLHARLLPDLASGHTFATIGISHLTTSRQHIGQPAVTARQSDAGYRLNGIIPWVTGAAYAQHVVTGATLDDGQQILLALPMDAPGIEVHAAAALLSLTASATASITLREVAVSRSQLLTGPRPLVLQSGSRSGTGSLVTSVLAAGLVNRCLKLIQSEATQRPELNSVLDQFTHEAINLDQLFSQPDLSSNVVRQRANSLALRISQATLAVSKGAGFVSGHPAERSVREALFFLVWSCPQPVVNAALDELVCRSEL